jgi:hypothetical protein
MSQLSKEETAAAFRLLNYGFSADVAEALACREYSVDDKGNLTHQGFGPVRPSVDTLLGEYLEWNGISGYTGSILAAVRNLDRQVSR